MKALVKDPDQRYQNWREMLEDLRITGHSARERQPHRRWSWVELAAATLISGNATGRGFSGEDQTGHGDGTLTERAGIGPAKLHWCGERSDCTRPEPPKKKKFLGTFFAALLLLRRRLFKGAYRIKPVFDAARELS